MVGVVEAVVGVVEAVVGVVGKYCIVFICIIFQICNKSITPSLSFTITLDIVTGQNFKGLSIQDYIDDKKHY